MTCDDHQQMISEFLDGELATSSERDLFAHISGCTSCREFMRSSIRTREYLAREEAPRVPASLDARITRLAGERIAVRPRVRRRILDLLKERVSVPVPALLLSSIVLALSLAVGGFLFATRESGRGATAQYIMSLPEVEVRGILPENHNQVH